MIASATAKPVATAMNPSSVATSPANAGRLCPTRSASRRRTTAAISTIPISRMVLAVTSLP